MFLFELQEALKRVDCKVTGADLGIGEITLKDIVQSLMKPGRDPRDELAKPLLKQDVLKMEDLSAGQRVEHFRIYAGEECLYRGYTVGHRKLCKVDVNTDTLTVFITGARDETVMRKIGVYAK